MTIIISLYACIYIYTDTSCNRYCRICYSNNTYSATSRQATMHEGANGGAGGCQTHQRMEGGNLQKTTKMARKTGGKIDGKIDGILMGFHGFDWCFMVFCGSLFCGFFEFLVGSSCFFWLSPPSGGLRQGNRTDLQTHDDTWPKSSSTVLEWHPIQEAFVAL